MNVRFIASAGTAALLCLTVATPTQAAGSGDNAPATRVQVVDLQSSRGMSVASGTTEAVKFVAKRTDASGQIRLVTVAEVSEPRTMTRADALAFGDPALLQAFDAGKSLTTKSWKQKHLDNPIDWNEIHTGSFAYDGTHVYVKSHVCGQGFGYGITVKVDPCNDIAKGTDGRANWDYFKVCFAKIVACESHNQHVNVYSRGGVFMYKDS